MLRFMCSDGRLYGVYRMSRFIYSDGGLYRVYRMLISFIVMEGYIGYI